MKFQTLAEYNDKNGLLYIHVTPAPYKEANFIICPFEPLGFLT